MRESEIERFFVKECKKRGWLCLKFVSPSMAGLPDRIVLAPHGRVFFAELKAPGQKPRKRQEAVHKILSQLGFYVGIIDSKEKAESFVNTADWSLYLDKKKVAWDEVHTP